VAETRRIALGPCLGQTLSDNRAMLLPTDLDSVRPANATPMRPAFIRTLAAVGGLLASSQALAGGDLLLIPDSGNDKIWALDPATGAVVNPDFIPDDQYLTQPIQIAQTPSGSLFITDETTKSVYEYSASGTYIRTVASPADGVTNGAFGLCIRDGFCYFTSGFSSGAGKILRVALSGGTPTVFCDFSAEGDPRGIVPFGSGFLVGNSSTDDIEIVSATGVVSPVPFHNSDGITSINFPQQLVVLPDGGVMAAGFSPPWGLFFYDVSGSELGSYRYPEVFLSPRGAFLLDNGSYLYTGGTRIDVINGKTQTMTNIVNQLGTSFRWATRFTPPAASCVGDIDGSGTVDAADLAALLGAWGSAKSPANLDGIGTVDAADLATLLGAWGACD
jgi:hypothetical protein